MTKNNLNKNSSKIASPIVIRRNDKVGAADAKQDKKFLEQCFIDNGDLDILTEYDEPCCIILGRTGTGKTALLEMLKEKEERVINIEPESLALNYISDNSIIRFFVEVGTNMDLFYRLLWRHVFAIEIIKVS